MSVFVTGFEGSPGNAIVELEIVIDRADDSDK